MKVDGVARKVRWGDMQHHDMSGRIRSVVEHLKGAVLLESGASFENPALHPEGASASFCERVSAIKPDECECTFAPP